MLATIPDLFGPGRSAEMAYYEHPSGARVFSGGALNFDGATAASPERVVIANPPPGVWTALINGFTVQFNQELWSLTATADGARLPRQ